MKSIFKELRRRQVFQSAALYIVAAWVIIQVAGEAQQAFELSGSALRYVWIATLIGFPVAVVFGWYYDITSDGIVHTPPAHLDADIDLSLNKTDYLIFSALLLVTVFIAYPFVGQVTKTQTRDAQTRVASEAPINSIAVLPFNNLSSDPEQKYFSDGLAEEILVALSRVPQIVVSPRARSFAYRGDSLEINQVADELGVRLVLAGSVRKAGDRVRVTAELIDTHTDGQLWTNVFERELDDIFAIQEQLAEVISHALEIRFEDARGNSIRVSGTNNVEAHSAYLKGRYLLHQRGTKNVSMAVRLFQKATEIDPDFAEAHASLAIAKGVGWGQYDRDGAAASARRAVSLEPSMAMGWVATGLAARLQFRFEEAERAYREALALQPENAEASHYLAWLLYDRGNLDEAHKLQLRAVSIDPATAIYRKSLGAYCVAMGRFEEGMAYLEEATEISSSVGTSLFMRKLIYGQTEDALTIFASEAIQSQLSDVEKIIFQALIQVMSGNIDEARNMLKDWEKDWDPGGGKSALVIVFAYLGRISEANWVLEQSISHGYTLPEIREYAKGRPDIPIRETRYNELRASIGLPGIDYE